jgi:serine protease inhibitor
MKRIMTIILVFMLCLTIFGCSSGDDSKYVNTEIVNTDEYNKVIKANKDFAFEVFNTVATDEKDKNVFISPISLTFALSMVYNGAMGETAENFAETMNISGVEFDKLNDSMLYLKYRLTKTKDSKIAIANSLWGNERVKFKDKFINDMNKYYKAEITSLDFTNPSSVKQINKWVSDKTNKMIDKIIEKTSPDDILYLMNAIYFKGNWKEEFDKDDTYQRDFNKPDGTISKVDMMHKYETDTMYTDKGKYKAARLSYGENERIGITFILPKGNNTVSNLLGELNGEKYQEIVNSMYEAELETLAIPKFKMKYKRELIPDLEKIGMTLPFSDKANFMGLADISNLIISEVFQKAIIDLNEKGTEAAAVTSIQVKETAAMSDPLNFIADRPFVFILDDTETDTILFMGVLSNPDTLE